MLLYHFPLNTQESIDNFTNKGIKNDYVVGSGFIQDNSGYISGVSANSNLDNTSCLTINNLQNYNKLSICFRFRLTATSTSYQSILWCNVTPNDNDQTRLYVQAKANSINSNIHLPNYGLNAVNFYQSSWYDIVVIKNQSSFEIYIDGSLYGSVSEQAFNFTKINFCCRSIGGGGKCNSLIQDIRIYDYALSQAEINEYSRALVVHYPLQGNELNQSVLKDVSGFGNDAIQSNGSYVTDSPRGEISLYKSGTEEYRTGCVRSVISTPTNYSISLWFKYEIDFTGNSTFIQFKASKSWGTVGSRLYIQANRVLIWGCYYTDNIWDALSVPTTTKNEWHHIVLTYDGQSKKLYYDSELKNTKTTPIINDYLDISKLLTFGGFSMSDYRIYATALSAEDIKNLYNSPISVSNQHQTMAFEFKENPLYPSKYWRTPTYAEMSYIRYTRPNAGNLRGVGKLTINNVDYNGLFILPDDWELPSGVTFTPQLTDFNANAYTLEQFNKLIGNGAVFFPYNGYRVEQTVNMTMGVIWLSIDNAYNGGRSYYNGTVWYIDQIYKYRGHSVRLVKDDNGKHSFKTPDGSIKFAPANLQYHCTQHIWRFAEHSYDIIGVANANISDSYNGWIDLFGYGTSGINYSPTKHTTTNSDYASGDIANTDNDWGINEIQSYDYNVKNFALNKNGIVQHNELRENDSDVNGCYQDKLITNELIEN